MAHSHHHHRSDKNGLSIAFWLNLLFSVVEGVGGILTNSTAIVADAFHDFMDAMAIGMAVLLEKLSGKKRTPRFSYGYKRFSLLAALGMSIFLLVGATLMVAGAVNSFIQPKAVNSMGMLWIALLGLAVNGFAFLRIKRGSGDHRIHSHNSKAIMLHLLEDVLGWIAVLVGAVVIHFTGWYWIDGTLTLMIAGFVGYNATKNLIGTSKVLLQSVPEHINVDQLADQLRQIDGVEDIHDVHVWSLDGNYHVGSLHAVVTGAAKKSEADIMDKVIALMKQHDIQHPTVQLERNPHRCGLASC